MDRLLPALLILIVVAAIFAGLALGWRARRRRQAGIPAPATPPAELGEVRASADVLYVATTFADAPTDRIAVRGLGFRARAHLTAADAGVVLAIAGEPEAFIPTADLVGTGRASWTIDRTVPGGGLLFLRWRLGDTEVDSYLRRPDDADLQRAIESLLPASPGAPTPGGPAPGGPAPGAPTPGGSTTPDTRNAA